MDENENIVLDVVICDDDPAVRDILSTHVLEYARRRGVDASIREYESAVPFLEAHGSFDVLFMDIYMDEMEGVEAAWRLSAEERKRIVFLTTSESHAIEAYQLGAAHYLLKPVSFEAVAEAIDRCAPEGATSAEQVLTVRTTDGIVPIPMGSISMVEAQDKVCAITTTSGNWRAYVPLSVLEGQLDGRLFLRVHRSYIVNMHHIKTLYHDHMVMDSGETIRLSRGRRQEIKQRYQDFMFAFARGELS